MFLLRCWGLGTVKLHEHTSRAIGVGRWGEETYSRLRLHICLFIY